MNKPYPPISPDIKQQIEDAYRSACKATKTTVHPDCAKHWWQEEDEARFEIGTAHYPTRKVLIYTIEAARDLCLGVDGMDKAAVLLKLALKELQPQLQTPEHKL